MKKIVLYIITLFLLINTVPTFAENTDELLPEERNTISIFQKVSPYVVNIHKINHYINPFIGIRI